jgi:hypothetical protein
MARSCVGRIPTNLGHVHQEQTPSLELHGEALLAAKRPELQPLIDHLREVAQGRDDIRTECAGVITGWWFADTARQGENLIAAGLLVLAGHVDLDELDGGFEWAGSVAAGQLFRTGTPANGLTDLGKSSGTIENGGSSLFRTGLQRDSNTPDRLSLGWNIFYESEI